MTTKTYLTILGGVIFGFFSILLIEPVFIQDGSGGTESDKTLRDKLRAIAAGDPEALRKMNGPEKAVEEPEQRTCTCGDPMLFNPKLKYWECQCGGD